MRKKLLVYDCSYSTTYKYWEYMDQLEKDNKFDMFIAWGDYPLIVKDLWNPRYDDVYQNEHKTIGKETLPTKALDLVEQEYKHLEGEWELFITTDGSFTQMTEDAYNDFVNKLTFIDFFKKICVFYIGRLNEMNLFLNYFLYRNKDFITHIYNSDNPSENCIIPVIDDINFENYLIAKVQIITLLAKYRNEPTAARQLYKRVKDYYAKKDKTIINVDIVQHLTAHVKNNAIDVTSSLINENDITTDLSEIEKLFASRNIQKIYKVLLKNVKVMSETNLLNLFSKDFNYLFRGTIFKAAELMNVENNTKIQQYGNEKHDLSICSILFEEITTPAILVKRSNLQLTSSEWAHPFQLITNKFKEFKQLFELNQINLSTYQQLVQPDTSSFRSPFTREECTGVFVFSLSTLKHNCKVLSLALGHNNMFYGNILNWNICCFYLLFLLYKEREDIHMQYIIASQIVELLTQKKLPIFWVLSRPTQYKTSLANSLWFNINFSLLKMKSKNSVMLRKWGYALYQLYDTFIKQYECPVQVDLVEVCFIWSWLVREKTNIWNLIHKLYRFKEQELPIYIFKNKKLTYYLFKNFLNKQSKLIDIPNLDSFDSTNNIALDFPVVKIAKITKEVRDDILNVEIDLQTCRPSVICCHNEIFKKCKQHHHIEFECRKAVSFFRIFGLFCVEKQKYPKNASELFDFYKRIIYNYLEKKYVIKHTPIDKYPVFVFDDIVELLDDVYNKYENVINLVDVGTFINRYNDSDTRKYKKN